MKCQTQLNALLEIREASRQETRLKAQNASCELKLKRMPTDIFKHRDGSETYIRVRNPYAVFFARNMGQGTIKQRLQMVRDYRELHGFIRGEWAHFHANAENNFTDNFAKKFWPGWFELRCSNLLRGKGLINTANGGGPDFLINKTCDSSAFALEATILTPGNSGASLVATFDAPEKAREFVINDVSDEKTSTSVIGERINNKNTDSQWNMSLRVTNTIENKRKQIERWIDSGAIVKTLPIVVAISPTYLESKTNRSFYCDDMERALFGKGHQVVTFKTNQNEPESELPIRYQQTQAMSNNSGATVNLGLFLNPAYSCISAVLLIQDSLFLSSHRTAHLYINPQASNSFVDTHGISDKCTNYLDGAIETKQSD